MPAWLPYVLVGIGGFFGSLARFLLARYIGGLVGTRWPVGTFVVNVTGSCLLGLIGGVVAARVSPTSEGLRLAIGVGFIGAYTTFSTLEYETHVIDASQVDVARAEYRDDPGKDIEGKKAYVRRLARELGWEIRES